MKPWERIRAFARSWGADVTPVRGPIKETRLISAAPFRTDYSLAIRWRPGLVLIDDLKLSDPHVIGGLIHELAHVLATRKRPDDSDEGDFLGWEFLTSQVTRCEKQWRANMSEYGFAPGDTWDDLTFRQQKAELSKAFVHGVMVGNIVNGKPVSVRRDLRAI